MVDLKEDGPPLKATPISSHELVSEVLLKKMWSIQLFYSGLLGYFRNPTAGLYYHAQICILTCQTSGCFILVLSLVVCSYVYCTIFLVGIRPLF